MQEISLHQIRKHFEHFMNGNLFWKRRLGYWTCMYSGNFQATPQRGYLLEALSFHISR